MAATLKPNAAAGTAGSNEIISISIDSMTGTVGNGKDESQQSSQQQEQQQQREQPMVLSKKALHQRDADENLFLRFLELDPPADGNANSTTGGTAGTGGTGGSGGTAGGGSASAAAAASANASNANHMNGGGSNSTRRCSTMPGGGYARGATHGRTPFTMTKRLTRTEERGFGFSIVWTHPPRVEKVEAGLSADRCGILPGDYVIFVDKHNVVTMPEADVLNLIRSQGSTLTLEIFRRSGAGASMASSQNAITTLSSANTLPAGGHRDSQRESQTQLGLGLGLGLGLSVGVAGEEHTMSVVQRTNSTPRTTTQLLTGNNQQSRPATACSGTTSSIEAAKRRLHLPQVTFSKEVGKGVIV